MIEALTFKSLNTSIDNRYEYGEQKIVGLMLARYGIRTTKVLINQNYDYWNNTSGKGFDIFWAGYGAYLPFSQESPTRTILDYPENHNPSFFDLDAFVTITQKTDKLLKKPYLDNVQLVLINCKNGNLRFRESIQIDLEKNVDPDYAKIRKIMTFIIRECRHYADVKDVAKKLLSYRIREGINGLSFSDLIIIAAGLIL